jgi:general secretion pathway protein M
MNAKSSPDRFLTGNPLVAVALYGAVVILLGFATWTALADIYERQVALSRIQTVLDDMEGRKTAPGGPRTPSASVPAGSPFVEGGTVTVAGAAILQRVAAAVTRYGGNMLSSQVGLEGPQSKTGMISVTVTTELREPQLQELLYDLESGMPFLFVDQLVVQMPQAATGTDGGRLRVLLGVSGQWQGAK